MHLEAGVKKANNELYRVQEFAKLAGGREARLLREIGSAGVCAKGGGCAEEESGYRRGVSGGN
jgi:hypothetical protein